MSKNDNKTYEKYLWWFVSKDEQWLKRYSKLVQADTYENVEEAWFLATCIEFYHTYGKPIPPDAFELELEEKKDRSDKFDGKTAANFFNAPAPDDATRAYMLDYSDKYLRRKLTDRLVTEYVQDVGDDGSFEEAYSVAAKYLDQLGRSTQGDQVINVTADLDATHGWLTQMTEDDGSTIPTGIEGVDDIMQGGLRKGELGVYLAPPGHGKSQWLTFVSKRAWECNKGVVYFSFEMAEDRILSRFYSGILNEDSNKVPFMNLKSFLTRVRTFKREKHITADFFVKRYPQAGANAREMQAVVKELQADGHDIGLIVVDYGDIAAPMVKARDRKEDQAAIYNEMRNYLAVGLELPVWTASQANRLALKRAVVTIEHIADSFDKAKIADYIIAQCQTEQEKQVNEARLFFAKCRYNGQGEQIPVNLDFSQSRFFENPFASAASEAEAA